MNNDHVTSALMRQRQADYQREVEHDELVAQAKRGDPNGDPGPGAEGPPVAAHWTNPGRRRRFRWLMGHHSMTDAHRW
jgi:hypothetical protein